MGIDNVYYDALKQRAQLYAAARTAAQDEGKRIESSIAPCYMPLHEDIKTGLHSIYHLPGGRGSCKSSFVSLEIVDGVMKDPNANAIVFRRVRETMRESVYTQIQWAIDELGAGCLWRGNVSPMCYTYLPTGQQILFRGLDDCSKLKSIKPRRGIFKFIWFEEFCELTGANMVRNVLQSVVRGGNGFYIFNSFNPPISLNNWANKYILQPDERAITFKTDYRMIPPEWLGENFLIEAARLEEINPQAYRHEYLGEAIGTGGEVFPNIQAREISKEEAENADYLFHGIDFGFAVDPCVYIRASYNAKRSEIIILDEAYKKHCSNAALAQILKEKRAPTGRMSITEWMPVNEGTIYADSAEPKSIADLKEYGFSVMGCHKFPGSVLYGVKWLQRQHIIIDPKRTPNAYREFTEYEYMTTKDGEFLADVPDKDNHCIDALRYAFTPLINKRGVSA